MHKPVHIATYQTQSKHITVSLPDKSVIMSNLEEDSSSPCQSDREILSVESASAMRTQSISEDGRTAGRQTLSEEGGGSERAASGEPLYSAFVIVFLRVNKRACSARPIDSPLCDRKQIGLYGKTNDIFLMALACWTGDIFLLRYCPMHYIQGW